MSRLSGLPLGYEDPPTRRHRDQAIITQHRYGPPGRRYPYVVLSCDLAERGELLPWQPLARLHTFPQCSANKPVRRLSAASHGADRMRLMIILAV